MTSSARRRIGQRYELFGAMAAGGTATVHLGRLHGTAGFMKPIAIKRLHPHLAAAPALRAILIEEARLVSRISHPNVVAVLDIVEDDGELFLVLEYVRGATLSELMAAKAGRCDPAIAVAVMRDVLTGLHAAHHARDASGALLGLVHRDVSPRNVIVTTDGIGKILDFGIAKARARQSTTRDDHVRGTLAYMAPEQLADETLTARTDVYGAAVVLWEALTGERLFRGDDAAIVKRILDHDVRAPSVVVSDLPRALDAVVLRGLARDPEHRFSSGLEMALALEESLAPSRPAVVAEWVTGAADKELARRQALLDDVPAEETAAVETPQPAVAPPISSSASAVVPMAPYRARVAILAGAVAIALAAARVLGGWGTAAPATIPRPSTSTTSSAALSSATSAVVVVPSADVAPPAPAPPESAHALRSAAPRTTARAGADAAKPLGAETATGVAADCPPYYVDSAGVRRFNRECLK